MGEEFGLALLKDVIVKHKDLDAGEILNAIFVAANKFGGKNKWEDDATVVVVKRVV
jgi:serine phosphatase RsbU (regulator of sigma subunit)